MSGSGLMDFLITLVVLVGVGALIFTAIEFISTDERFKKIAKIAVGVVLVALFLFAVKAVLFGGGGGPAPSIAGLIAFAVGVIVVLVVWYVITIFLNVVMGWMPSLAPFKEMILFVVGAIILIVILLMAASMLLGGGGDYFHFQWGGQRHTFLEYTRELAALR
jgi:hypothetical protein